MTKEEAIEVLAQDLPCETDEDLSEAMTMAIKSLEAWEKIDDEIASLQDTYSIGNTYTEKLVWENLQAVRKTIHEYLKEVSGCKNI